ncbi:FAD-dependent oxidoreductase [Mycobacterium sp. NPDC051804]|uniref:FAD-dependent oxidoreductase n=1 Tax=Mycobacterium sp. NPDC051804 TaxID=3364295 RepID=UPI00378F7722
MSAAIEATTMFNSELVDIVCIGTGSMGLAAAISSADSGLSVFVAEPRRRPPQIGSLAESAEAWAAQLQRYWGADELDGPTTAYLREMTSDLGTTRRSHANGQLFTAAVESFGDIEVDRRAAVPPFYGNEMANWARDCLTSPYGMVFSKLSPLAMSELRLQDGRPIRARVVADIPSARRSGLTLRQWLREMAKERGVKIHGSSAIQRLLFNDGQPVGAVIDTPSGVRHVRARQAVLLGTSNSLADDLLGMHPASVLREGRLSLVSRNASRFARLELLTTAEGMNLCAPQSQLA